MDNQAGKHTQSALNEEDNIMWTRDALSHYQVRVGKQGDSRYLQGWHGKEGNPYSYRWSEPLSRIILPVIPGEAYTITLEGDIPAQAVTPEAGLYLDGRKIGRIGGGQRGHRNFAIWGGRPGAAGSALRRLGAPAGGFWIQRSADAGHSGVQDHHARCFLRYQPFQCQ